MCDLRGLKVIYNETVLNAVAVMEWMYEKDMLSNGYNDFRFLTVMVVDTNGNLKAINDEAWRFQFIPNVTKGA
jgi:hypothetical protein